MNIRSIYLTLLGVLALLQFGSQWTMAQTAATADDAYVVEEIQMPKGVAPEIGGLAFNSKGELIVVTRRSGILIGTPTTDPSAFKWRVFSDQSLHEPLGVLVEKDNQILVPQFPELTRISDTDGDGVADLYETVGSSWGMTGNYHESVVGPVPSGDGGWFLAVGTASHNGPTFDYTRGKFSAVGRRGRNFSGAEYRGWVVKLMPDGTLIPWASGFRANNGICVGPDGSLWVTDNQGDYIPTSPLHHVEKGRFYGHPSSLVWDREFVKNNAQRDPLKEGNEKLDAMRTMPAVQFPYGIMANSPAMPIFDTTGGKFGPFAGQMFIPDESGQRVLRVMLEKVGGDYQGACTFLLRDHGLRSGNNRLCFSPDGTVMYTGQTMRGWGGPVEGLQRIRYTGKPPFEVREMHLLPDGFELTFTEAPESSAAADIARYRVQSYRYAYSQQYGAPQSDIAQVKVTGVKVSDNGLKVRLTLDKLTAGKIYQLDIVGLATEGGRWLGNPMLAYTVNRLVK
ncbi:MAG TPA: hypothetical protein VK968_19330 [Roseimicrobium sp.]|nr:hypothetical protein [Roseimicrobium sp.]